MAAKDFELSGHAQSRTKPKRVRIYQAHRVVLAWSALVTSHHSSRQASAFEPQKTLFAPNAYPSGHHDRAENVFCGPDF
jgi:hypothetical protein